MLDANIHRITIIVAERSLSGKSAARGSFDSAGISPARRAQEPSQYWFRRIISDAEACQRL